jgi:hypothetical protein
VLFDRRRRYIVNPRLQYGLLLTSLAHVGFLALVVSLALFAPLVLELRRPDWNAPETTIAALQLLYLHETYWIPMLIALVAIGLHSVSVSHRIAGPIYRFRRVCEAMTAGTIPGPVTLRRGDQLTPELDDVNAMLAAWRERIVVIQREAAALREALGRPDDSTNPADDAHAAGTARLDELAGIERRLRAALSGISVET